MSKEFQIRDGNLIASFDLENGDGDIDFCKLLKVSQGVVEEIGMFVDYVATNKIIKDQSKKISNLEAKLAEKDQAIESLQEINQSLGQTCNNDAKEIERLREQLAEKEKEIANIQHRLKVAEKALTKAVNDKCFAEDIIAESFVGKGAKVAVPKKEQWYLEQAEKEV